MASDLEEQKKAILPFMQRAQEIQQADPKVAYYCRMYAVDQALKLPHRAKEITGLVTATLSQLERDKAALKLDPGADRIYCLGFALRIFDNADRVDRAGRATERTSRAFYAASVFIEILNQFEGGVDAELLEKQRYCAWRAAEIRKALREGRQPTLPPAATPPADADPTCAASGVGGAAVLGDLPPESGSNDREYGRQGEAAASSSEPSLPPPTALSDGRFTYPITGSQGPGAASGDSFSSGWGHPAPPVPQLHDRAPPPSVVSSFGWGSEGLNAPSAPLPPPPIHGGAAAVARFWPGAKVLVDTEEGAEGGEQPPSRTHVGTVGQVIRRTDGGFSYKVALTDRQLEIPDEAAVPFLEEGATVCWVQPPGTAGSDQQPFTVKVLFINDASWPPSYLVQTADGREHAVSAQQLGPLPRDGVAMQAGPPVTRQRQHPAQQAESAPPMPQPLPPLATASSQAPPAPSGPPSHPPYGASGPSAPSPFSSASSYGGHAVPPPPPAAQAYSHSFPGPVPSAAPASVQGCGLAAPPIPSLPPCHKPPVQVIVEAQKQARYAVSALSFEDISTAVKHLGEALRLLTNPQAAVGGPRT